MVVRTCFPTQEHQSLILSYVRKLKFATPAEYEAKLSPLRQFLKVFKCTKISKYLEAEWVGGEWGMAGVRRLPLAFWMVGAAMYEGSQASTFFVCSPPLLRWLSVA